MTSTIDIKGTCLCGTVKVSATKVNPEVGACHCNMCRKWTGGIFLVIDCKDQVTFTGEQNISRFNSSEWAERGFCIKCGTHLFYRLKDTNQHFIPSELFDPNSKLHFGHQIFIEEKPSYYTFSNDTKNMTGAEVFAQFSADES